MSNTEMVNVSAVSFIRREAIKVAQILKANETFMDEFDSAILAIEEGKRGSLTTLYNAQRALPKDVLDAMPKVGSHPIPGKTNLVSDYYMEEGQEKSYYDDLADWLEPAVVKCHEAMKLFAKDQTITPDMPKGFEYPGEGDKTGIDRLKTKYAQRRSNMRGMVRKAFKCLQLVEAINSLPLVGCKIEMVTSDSARPLADWSNVTGYDQSPKPITIWERVEAGEVAPSVAWSVSSLLLLSKEVEDDKGVPTGLTMFDVAKAKGGTFKEITSVVKRERDAKNAKTNAVAAYKVTKPAEFVGNVDVLGEYFGIGLPPKEQAEIETKLVAWLLTKADDEQVRTFSDVASAFDSVTSKIDGRIRKALAAKDQADGEAAA